MVKKLKKAILRVNGILSKDVLTKVQSKGKVNKGM